jgi:Ca-activated chloride channel homolog
MNTNLRARKESALTQISRMGTNSPLIRGGSRNSWMSSRLYRNPANPCLPGQEWEEGGAALPRGQIPPRGIGPTHPDCGFAALCLPAVNPLSRLCRAVILLMMLVSWTASAVASPSSALREYNSGNFAQSLKDYEGALAKKKDDPRLNFNAGAAAYRNHQFDRAAKHFGEVLGAPDLKLQEQAYYNLGNTLYRLGAQAPDPNLRSKAWEQSLQQYQSTLKLNNQDADAKFNYEFVKKKLEQLKKQQQQQQQDNKNQKQENNPDKNQQQKQNQEKNQEQAKNQNQNQGKNQEPQQAPQQKQQSSEQQQAENQKKEQEQAEAGKKQAQQSPGEEKKAQQREQAQEQQANAASEMTPQEARRLLDAQKSDELMLPVSRKQQPNDQEGPIKDW